MAYNLRSRNQKGKCGLLTESEDETFESEDDGTFFKTT